MNQPKQPSVNVGPLVFCGGWDPEVQYQSGAIVSFNKFFFLAITPSNVATQGQQPGFEGGPWMPLSDARLF